MNWRVQEAAATSLSLIRSGAVKQAPNYTRRWQAEKAAAPTPPVGEKSHCK